MEKNIFEDAHFGDKFKTLGGEVAIYQGYFKTRDYDYPEGKAYMACHKLITPTAYIMCDDNGKAENYSDMENIVSKCNDDVDEEWLNDMAEDWNINYAIHPCTNDIEGYYQKDVVEAFKYGYKEAIKKEGISEDELQDLASDASVFMDDDSTESRIRVINFELGFKTGYKKAIKKK